MSSKNRSNQNMRVSKKSGSALESPGDPNEPSSFIACHEVESKTAAYLGYSNTEDLRKIVLCWPVLSAIVQIQKNPKYTNARGAFKILNDDLQSYKNIADAAIAFPLTGSEPQQKTAANRRLAAILSKMIEDFALMSTLSNQDNTARHNDIMATYKKDFPNRSNVPLLSPSKCLGPILGPLEDESDLEPHNRCWMLTKYFKYCQQLAPRTFETRFPPNGDIKGSSVPLGMVPAWMRPKPKAADPESAKSEAMLRLNSLPKKKFTLQYASRLDNPDCKDDLEENFEKALERGIEPMITTRQDFWIDPRLYDSISSLRDQLRRQLCCHVFRTNLARVVLKFKHQDADGIFNESADLMHTDWDVIKAILHDEANDDFSVQIGLWAMDHESTHNIFEEFDVPPHLRAYFKPVGVESSRDIATNPESIQANAHGTFGGVDNTTSTSESNHMMEG